jgi:hypothetical protein
MQLSMIGSMRRGQLGAIALLVLVALAAGSFLDVCHPHDGEDHCHCKVCQCHSGIGFVVTHTCAIERIVPTVTTKDCVEEVLSDFGSYSKIFHPPQSV